MPDWAIIATRSFSPEDQSDFAALSGDYNPIHLDPVAARRTQAGIPVVHGIHGLLWALDSLCGLWPMENLCHLKVRFDRFIPLDTQVSLRARQSDAAKAQIEVLVDGIASTQIVLSFVPRAAALVVPRTSEYIAVGQHPQSRTIAQMSGLTAGIDRTAPLPSFTARFPALAGKLGAERVSALAGLSCVVGMICPGLHSIFTKVTLDMVPLDQTKAGIQFEVIRADERLRSIALLVAGDGINGTIEAFARIPPIAQANVAELQGWVRPDAFQGSTALIIGGSRGLGELTAKLIATGGGECIITYAVGRDEAEAVQRDIVQAGGKCHVMKFDIRQDIPPQLQAIPRPPTQLYYFASPRIARPKSTVFSARLFDEFIECYVTAFYRICTALSGSDQRLRLFYPSSVFVEDRPRDMTEYAMAKSAGEILCADINAAQTGLQVQFDRLPRMLTDQTSSLLAQETASSLDVMSKIVQQMQHPVK